MRRKWWQYILNPLLLGVDFVHNIQDTAESQFPVNDHGEHYESGTNNVVQKSDIPGDLTDLSDRIVGFLTGEDQIRLQNELQRELMEEEYQRNLQSIGDTAAAYEAAGFNRNLVYGSGSGSPVSYTAPQLQAYSGSKKIDAILQKTGKVLQMIPAMYQATAALEGIDQARERTKQSEIKTMSMGMSLLDQGYKLGKTQASFDWWPNLSKDWFSSRRHFRDFEGLPSRPLPISQFSNSYQRYSDAALKYQFDLLNSIGIKNQMNQTLSDWRGYQYSLDRRFGAAGRIVGMASQGLRSAGSLFSPIKLFGGKYK